MKPKPFNLATSSASHSCIWFRVEEKVGEQQVEVTCLFVCQWCQIRQRCGWDLSHGHYTRLSNLELPECLSCWQGTKWKRARGCDAAAGSEQIQAWDAAYTNARLSSSSQAINSIWALWGPRTNDLYCTHRASNPRGESRAGCKLWRIRQQAIIS